MPAKMSMLIPLPMPRWVIWSPSHIRNIVPVVTVRIASRVNGQRRHASMASGMLFA